jgi:hypothetical protein
MEASLSLDVAFGTTVVDREVPLMREQARIATSTRQAAGSTTDLI